jgi:cell division protein FtsI/penicillin-binding protein 2
MHPGSTAKPFTAVALIDSDASTPQTCSGTLRIKSRRFDCSHPTVTGPVDLPVAVAYSCNQFFTSAAARVDASRLTSTFLRYGFEAQAPGSPEHRALLAIGEWGVSCTVMELAQAYRRLALVRERYRPIWQGLEAAGEYGTARLAKPSGVAIAGKTGTSRYALFAGWAPAGKPKIVVAVLVPGGRGGADAAPIARSLFEKHL